ncbi:MAG: hypothetical protein KAU48_08910 [Candidatus Thorarchaeota archaeon]|nr:hypothetical protein [Candidatus Thorarchaeota archaeon]
MNKQQRFLIVLACGLFLLTSSVPVLNMAPVTNDSLYSQQDLMYYLSQDNQTQFSYFESDTTWTYHPTCAPSVYIDVVDLDGVASVWFSYKRSNESQWNNKSMVSATPLGENTFAGWFHATVSEYHTDFDIRFFVNDSLGHISKSGLYGLTVDYSRDYPTPTTEPTPESDIFLPLIGAVTISIIIVSLIAIALKVKDHKDG